MELEAAAPRIRAACPICFPFRVGAQGSQWKACQKGNSGECTFRRFVSFNDIASRSWEWAQLERRCNEGNRVEHRTVSQILFKSEINMAPKETLQTSHKNTFVAPLTRRGKNRQYGLPTGTQEFRIFMSFLRNAPGNRLKRELLVIRSVISVSALFMELQLPPPSTIEDILT